MRNPLRRWARRALDLLDQRFEHADRRLVDSVGTLVRHSDTRFGELSAKVDRRADYVMDALARLQVDVETANSTMVESTAYVGRALRDLMGLLERWERFESGHGWPAELPERTPGAFIDLTAEDPSTAAGGVGPWPAGVGGDERLVELSYVLRAMGQVPAGSSVLGVGATESMLSLSLASLGYEVTAVDPRPYPFRHPNLRAVANRLDEWESRESFDALFLVFGHGDGSEEADLVAMRRVAQLAKSDSVLVLMAPFGRASGAERAYDKAGLDQLLEGWSVQDCTIVEQVDRRAWMPSTDGAVDDDRRRVALVTARLP